MSAITMQRLNELEAEFIANDGATPEMVQDEFRELLGAAAYALTLGYCGDWREHMKTAALQAALDS
jgi:hypothetical protein